MYKVVLPIGKRTEEVMVPKERLLYDIRGNKAEVAASFEEATRRALVNPIGSGTLEQIVQAGDRVAIVISDITRLCGTDKFLPVILEELNRIGVPDSDIRLVVATGTHRGHTPEEDEIVCGRDIARRLQIIQHDSRSEAELAYVGTTSFGTQVWLNRAVVEADKVIITGAASLHPFAGFGGGRKAVMPGVAGYDTIMQNHSMALAPTAGEGCNPLAEASILEDNPVSLDMVEACRLLDPDFLVNTVYTPEGELHEVVAGHWYEAWRKGCEDILQMAGTPIREQADVVFASAGGFPKDLNLYQGTKCHMNAVFAVKKGGILIAALDCEDIKEPAIFSDWFARGDLEALERDVRADFTIPGFVAFKARCIVNSLTVYLVTRPENFAFVEQTGQIPCRTLAEAWEKAQARLAEQGKKDYTITVMGHASATLPILTK